MFSVHRQDGEEEVWEGVRGRGTGVGDLQALALVERMEGMQVEDFEGRVWFLSIWGWKGG